MNSPEAILAVDRVAYLNSLSAFTGVSGDWLIRSFPSRILRAARGKVALVGCSPDALLGAPGYLLHQATLSEVRWRLGAHPADWQLPHKVGEVIPDAFWRTPLGVVAVELDVRYSPEKVRRKVSAYREGYARQVWATPSRTRLRWLKELLGNHGEVIYVETLG